MKRFTGHLHVYGLRSLSAFLTRDGEDDAAVLCGAQQSARLPATCCTCTHACLFPTRQTHLPPRPLKSAWHSNITNASLPPGAPRSHFAHYTQICTRKLQPLPVLHLQISSKPSRAAFAPHNAFVYLSNSTPHPPEHDSALATWLS